MQYNTIPYVKYGYTQKQFVVESILKYYGCFNFKIGNTIFTDNHFDS